MPEPILYSFRRCPYAMRARLAVQVSGVRVETREVLLRDKAPEFLSVSPDGTVPLLIDGDEVVAESLDIMFWALEQSDPAGWRDMPDAGRAVIKRFDGPFKRALDLTKYASRHPDSDAEQTRAEAMAILAERAPRPWLFGDRPTVADMAVLPFVRQFAMIDKARFDREATPDVSVWLERFLNSDLFAAIMPKLPRWQANDTPTHMPFQR